MTATASVLRAMEPARDELLDRRDELLDRIPDLSQMDLPSLELLGRRADEAVDKLRGRSRRPAWPWLLGGVVVIGVAIAAASAVMTWSRSRTQPWPDDGIDGLDHTDETGMTGFGSTDVPLTPAPASGLTAVEDSLGSYDPLEGRGA
jgi:hypothetical protein